MRCPRRAPPRCRWRRRCCSRLIPGIRCRADRVLRAGHSRGPGVRHASMTGQRAEDPLIVASEEVADPARAGLPGVGDAMFRLGRAAVSRGNARRKTGCAGRPVCWAISAGTSIPDYRAEQVYFRILRLPLLGVSACGPETRIALAVYRRYGGSNERSGAADRRGAAQRGAISSLVAAPGGRPAAGGDPDRGQRDGCSKGSQS